MNTTMPLKNTTLLEERSIQLKHQYFERKLKRLNHGVTRLVESKELQKYLKNRKPK